VRVPGTTPAGGRCDALVETVDIFPTLLELCGLPELPVSDGQSFVPLLKDPRRPWKDAAFHVFNRNQGGPVIGHAVRTKRYRLVSWNRGWGMDGEQVAVELYDYQTDPNETQNVAEDASYAQTRRDLLQTLRNGPAGKY
jgi:iduronate 2-sulfatase